MLQVSPPCRRGPVHTDVSPKGTPGMVPYLMEGHRPAGMTLQGRHRGQPGCTRGTPLSPAIPLGRFHDNAVSPARQAAVAHVAGATRRRRGARGWVGPRDRDSTGGSKRGQPRMQTSAACRDSRHVYLQQQNKEPIIYTKHTTMSVNKEAAGEGKAIYSNSANFSSSTIKKALIIFRNNRQLTNRFSRCK